MTPMDQGREKKKKSVKRARLARQVYSDAEDEVDERPQPHHCSQNISQTQLDPDFSQYGANFA
jgi:hypothetical protein